MIAYIDAVRKKLNKHLFLSRVKEIRKTKPIDYRYDDDVIIVSMVHHAALDMYLVAIKSFLYHFCSGSVHVLNDGSLTEEDVQILKYHVPRLQVEHIGNISTEGCPRGGTWERLLYLIDLSREAYVIQLDSDTITKEPLLDVFDMVAQNRGFTITGSVWNRPVHVKHLSPIVSNWCGKSDRIHVQFASEAIFDRLDFFCQNAVYIRGCSGFTGFPRNSIVREDLVAFSQQVAKVIGDEKWSEWGSEQVASNVMVSATPNAKPLPWPLYQNYRFPVVSAEDVQNSAFMHFIGSGRYKDRCYERMATWFIRRMR